MRPHKPTSRSRRASDRAVKKLLQWGLGWLRGYPAEQLGRGQLRWVIVPRPGRGRLPESIVLDGAALSRATRNRNRLLADFPRALPRVVGDREVWRRRTGERLDAVKPLVHRGDALPGALELLGERRVDGRLAPRITPGAALEVVVARAWWLYEEGEERGRALRFLAGNAEAAARLLEILPGDEGRDVLLALGELAVDGAGEPVAGLLRFLAERRAHETSLAVRWSEGGSGTEAALSWLRKTERWPVPSTPDRPASCLCRLLPRLIALEKDPREALLPVLEALLPDRSLGVWAEWWNDIRHWTRVLASQRDGDGSRTGDSHPLPEEALSLAQEHPAAFDLASMVDQLLEVAADPKARAWFREAGRGLPILPELFDGAAVRLGLVAHWLYLHRSSGGRDRLARLAEIVRSTVEHLADPVGHPRRYRYWRRIMPDAGDFRRHWDCLDADLLDGSLEPATTVVLFDALAALAERPDIPEGWNAAALLEDLLPAIPDGEAAVRWAHDLHRVKLAGEVIGGCRQRLQLVFALSRGRPQGVLAMLRATTDREFERKDVRLAAELLAEERFGQLSEQAAKCHPRELCRILEALVRIERRHPGEGKKLLAEHTRALHELPPAEALAWCEAYPEELRPLLGELQAATPRAEAICARAFGRLQPDREALETEISHLRKQLADGRALRPEHLRLRLDRLEARLRDTTIVGETRWQRTLEKLRARILRERVQSLRGHLDERYRQLLAMVCEESEPLALPEDPATLLLLDHLLDLPPRIRQLGLRLLRRRAGPPPWDLRDDPPNRKWLERARARGLRLEKWLDGSEPVAVASSSGRELRLSLEPDPLEILRMGKYFHTCLSPGGQNFYSAVLNAADSNKQVLYARDDRGRVHGRCLLAVTRENGLLAFEPYHHDTAPDFPALAGSFIERLADDLGAEVALRGHVEDLHRGDWYDDGPEDVTGRFGFLEEGSEFIEQLARLAPAELIPRLTELSGQDPPRIALLRMLLDIERFQQRPELVLPLLELLEVDHHHSAKTRCQIANMLRRTGELELARGWLDPLVDVYRGRRRIPDHWFVLASELLESGDPCAALDVLGRSSRRRASYDDPAEWSWYWHSLAGRAHELLGRDRQALEACSRADRLIETEGGYAGSQEHRVLRERITELRRRLGEV